MNTFQPVLKSILIEGLGISYVFCRIDDANPSDKQMIGYCLTQKDNLLHIHLTPQAASDCFRTFCKEKMNGYLMGHTKIVDADWGTSLLFQL